MGNCSTGGEGLYLQSSAGQRLFSGDNPVCDPAALSMAKLFPPGDHLLLWEDKENSVSSWSRERGQGGWEGRRGAEQEEGRSRQQQDLCVFLSCCKDLPADMETGRSFVVNHLKKAAFCPFLPILQFLDPTLSVLPCFIYRASTRHITTARSLPPCPALFSSIFLLPDFP